MLLAIGLFLLVFLLVLWLVPGPWTTRWITIVTGFLFALIIAGASAYFALQFSVKRAQKAAQVKSESMKARESAQMAREAVPMQSDSVKKAREIVQMQLDTVERGEVRGEQVRDQVRADTPNIVGSENQVYQRKRERDREEDTAIQAYLGQLAPLLAGAERSRQLQLLAHAQTLAIFERLGKEAKRHLLNVLYSSGLIKGEKPEIELRSANLKAVALPNDAQELRSINLSYADLRNASLKEASLPQAFLTGAILLNAKLTGADLSRSDLREADLRGAVLRGVDLREADLRGADLSGTNLREADLREADLSGTNLSEAVLRGADLSGVELTKARVTDEQLATSKSLEEAIMPDGQKFEDWPKGWDPGESEHNSGPS
jgi:uncharacterized protein YjbI with pentapeptide repeats